MQVSPVPTLAIQAPYKTPEESYKPITAHDSSLSLCMGMLFAEALAAAAARHALRQQAGGVSHDQPATRSHQALTSHDQPATRSHQAKAKAAGHAARHT